MILVFDNSELSEPLSVRTEAIASFKVTGDKDSGFYFNHMNLTKFKCDTALGKTPSPELIWLAIAYGEALGLACLIINEYDFDQTLADLTKQISSRQLREESLIWTSKR